METKLNSTKKRKLTQQEKGKKKQKINKKLKLKHRAKPNKTNQISQKETTQQMMNLLMRSAKAYNSDNNNEEPKKDTEHDTSVVEPQTKKEYDRAEVELMDGPCDDNAHGQPDSGQLDSHENNDENDVADHCDDFDPTTVMSLSQDMLMISGDDLCTAALEEIFERIPLHLDVLNCALLSKRWRSIVMDNLHRFPQKLPLCYCLAREHTLPLLMQCDEEDAGKINLLSVVDNKSLPDFFVPEISANWIAGSSNGCLVINEVLGQKVHLLNPLTMSQITLPSLSNFFNRFEFPKRTRAYEINKIAYIRKALVLSNPNARNLDDCIVIAIVSYWHLLSFCRPGDDKWTNINKSPHNVDDVINYKGQLYAIIKWGGLVRFDLEQQGCVILVGGHENGCAKPGKRYLVESSSGDLLLVLRTKASDASYLTSKFYVFKLEEVNEAQDGLVKAVYLNCDSERIMKAVKYKWVKIESLDDQILFIGRNSSKSVPTSLYPHLKGNCIYFTDDDLNNRHARYARAKAGDEEFEVHDNVEKYHMGIYDMEDESVRPIGMMDDRHGRVPPVWLEPNIWLKNN